MRGRRKSIRCLIAEDEFLVRKEIERCVRQVGFVVAAAVGSGEAAIEATVEKRPDVVLMDIQMPGMTGLEAAGRIQQRCPTPVVVLTAHESSGLVSEASDMGVGAYLTKPPHPSEIERAVVIAMARHKDMSKLRHLYAELEARNHELEHALADVTALRGLLPICAWCKKIRDDDGYWQNVETYLAQHSDATFTHGICPECRKGVVCRSHAKARTA